MTKYNKPLDRDYFKKKANPKAKKGPQLTECCGENTDHVGINVKNKEDWELVELHIEDYLRDYPGIKNVTPISCDICGRLIEYSSTLNDKDSE